MADIRSTHPLADMNRLYRFLDFLVFDPRYRRTRLVLALAVYFLVLALGSVPGARAEVGKLAPGVVLHALTYAFITAMVFGGLGRTTAGPALFSLLVVSAMGALDEFVQSFLPYRTAAVADWGVDVVSGLSILAFLLMVYVAGRRHRQPALPGMAPAGNPVSLAGERHGKAQHQRPG
ncbi:MAG: hypothetical protein H6R10_1571 [Rhodocyclaceae bacterium]|nr:hypothetical protein [Rhodocyclaceae bacterium]